MIQPMEFYSLSMEEKLSFFQNEFLDSQDLIIRPFNLKNNSQTKVALLYINNIVKTDDIQKFILRPLLESKLENDSSRLENFIFNSVQISNLIIEKDPLKLIDYLLKGNTLILIEGVESLFVADTPAWEKRSPSSPVSERGKGSLIAFTEDLTMNLNIIRKIVKNNNLVVETKSISDKTKTNYSIVYVDELVDRIALNELYKKLNEINLDFIFDTNYLVENLQEKNESPFPLIMTTERPDTACSSILQGRIAILLEGAPYVLILPVTLPTFMQAADDYFFRWDFGINRILRLICLIITIYTPGIYISLVCFHEEMLPSSTYFTLISQSEGVPFPLVIEVCFLGIILQIMMDAIFRMNRDHILLMSILGTFIIGDVAVNAGLIRPASIIVISLTFIANFIQPRSQDLFGVIRNLRFILMLMGNLLGFYGLIITSFFVLLHLSSLRSFGVPYLSPIAPFNKKEQKDTLIRGDINAISNSPHHFRHEELVRMKKSKEKR